MYLVTGGGGFIGSSIVRRLVEGGETVRVLDDFSTGRRENLAGLALEEGPPFRGRGAGVELVTGSILDGEALAAALAGVSYVFHEAAIPSVPRSIADPVGSCEVNAGGTLRLLEAARLAGVRRVVYAASSSAYGDTEVLPKEESMPARPLSPYAAAKYSGELYMQVYAGIYGLETVSLRYFNIFGPGQNPDSEYAAVIPRFIIKILEGRAPVVFGDGEQSRDFTYIDNAVEANLLACHSKKVGRGEVINVACGERYSLNHLLRLLGEITGREVAAQHEPPRAGDVRHSQADITSARELLDYRGGVSFQEGLARTVKWFAGKREDFSLGEKEKRDE